MSKRSAWNHKNGMPTKWAARTRLYEVVVPDEPDSGMIPDERQFSLSLFA